MKNTNNTLAVLQLNQAIEGITDMSIDDTIALYNDYANHNGYDMIFDNDEQTINDLFLTPYDAIRQTNNKDYKDHESYFTFNGYGHAISFDYRLSDNSPIDIEELAQWLINEDKLADYDIAVTTIEDMLASIEDNINDDKQLLNKLICYLGLSAMLDDSYKISDSLNELIEKDYNQLNAIINHLGINYQ